MTSHREPKPHIEHRHFKPLFNYSEAINCLQTVVQSLVDMTKPACTTIQSIKLFKLLIYWCRMFRHRDTRLAQLSDRLAAAFRSILQSMYFTARALQPKTVRFRVRVYRTSYNCMRITPHTTQTRKQSCYLIDRGP